METQETYLKRLNLDETATLVDIKKAYKELAFLYHPDTGGVNGNANRFMEIFNAYEWLKRNYKSSPKRDFLSHRKDNITQRVFYRSFKDNLIKSIRYYEMTLPWQILPSRIIIHGKVGKSGFNFRLPEGVKLPVEVKISNLIAPRNPSGKKVIFIPIETYLTVRYDPNFVEIMSEKYG